MERISVIPESIRGLGNVVSPKSTVDFMLDGGYLTYNSEVVDGKVTGSYGLSHLADSVLSLTVPSSISGESFTVSGLLKTHGGLSTISGATVYCQVNNGDILSGVTNSSGVVVFTVPVTGASVYSGRVFYNGDSSHGAVFASFSIVDVVPDSIDLVSDKSIIGTGDYAELLATVLDENEKPVPYQTVYFFEEYTETSVNVWATNPIIQSGETSEFKATVHDEDGSLIEGETVYFYGTPNSQGVLINDPTEHNVTSGNVELYHIYNLETDWKLECDLKTYCESRLWIGRASSVSDGNPNYSLFVGSPANNKAYYGNRTTSTNPTDINSYTSTAYTHMSITKTGNTVSFNLNGTTGTNTVSWFDDYCDDIVIGLVAWNSATDGLFVKNIKFEVISNGV